VCWWVSRAACVPCVLVVVVVVIPVVKAIISDEESGRVSGSHAGSKQRNELVLVAMEVREIE
jgi:hypothetical protein